MGLSNLQKNALFLIPICLAITSCGGGNSATPTVTPPPPPPPPISEITLYQHIVTYGQSLARGALATPIISSSQPYGNLTFSEGMHARGFEEGYVLDSFMPLIEEELNNQGETPTAGTANYIVELAEEEDLIPWDEQESAFIGSSPGRRGFPIAQLNKGTTYWNAILDQVSAAKQLTEDEGKTYRVAAMTWTQGETDYANATTRSEYKQLFTQMTNDFIGDVVSITEQEESPVLISYQLSAHRRYENDDFPIALAQKEVADTHSSVFIATPMYHLEYGDDNLHLTAEGSLMLGHYYGLVLKKLLIDETTWEPLQPESITWNESSINISLHVPEGELTFDTSVVSEAPNFGFDIWTPDNNDILDIISSVSIEGDNVIIQLSQTAPVGSRLTYARGRPSDPFVANRVEGPRGNIRDSQGDNYQYLGQDGFTRRLDNYLVMFESIKP